MSAEGVVRFLVSGASFPFLELDAACFDTRSLVGTDPVFAVPAVDFDARDLDVLDLEVLDLAVLGLEVTADVASAVFLLAADDRDARALLLGDEELLPAAFDPFWLDVAPAARFVWRAFWAPLAELAPVAALARDEDLAFVVDPELDPELDVALDVVLDVVLVAALAGLD